VDNLRVLHTPNYYVQQAFMRSHGDVVLPETPGSIETGRWYDVKVALRGHHL
jgi:hypothetical protein